MDAQETSKCHLACGATISEYLIVHNYADMYLGSYLSAPLIEMNSASLLKIKAKGLVKTERLNMKNPCTIAVIGEELDYAVLSADVIEINQSDVKQMFTGWMDIHYKEIENKSGSELEWLSSIKFNGNTYLAKDKCRPAFGQEPAIEEKPETGIEHIAQIETPDHGHYISATCIQTSAGKAYVSYHTQGTDYHGCIEALEYTGDNCSILSYMEHPDLDFNHLIIDNNRIITAGDNPKKGAFLGIINLQGGIFQTSSPEFTQIKLEGASANCVIRNGSYLHATTNDGYHTLENDTYYTVSSVASAGSSKFIDANGSNMGILSLSDKDSEQSMATLRVFNTSDYTYSSPVHTMNMDIITPTNGKNVLRIDGNDVYVCLGRNGVKRYTNGAESASFKLEDDSKAAANGLAVDNNYVYVAYGNGGLFILNKSDLSLVASYRHSGGKSANYVTVNGNVLYVAYGLNGVQVFKFITK